MTVKDVQAWCKANKLDARGIIRGAEFFIRHGDAGSTASQPPIGEVLHWQVTIGGQSYPSSPSDMERLVTGKMSLEDFAKAMAPRPGRGGE